MIAELHRALNEQSHLDTSRYLEEYRKNCFIIGRNVTVSETGKEPYTAYVEGVDPEFRLQVKTPEEHRLLSGRGSFPEIIGTAISGVRIPPGLCSYYLRTF